MDADRKNQPQAKNQTPNTEPADAEDSDVVGHMNPQLAMDIGNARHQELLTRADRDRQAKDARGQERDGGMLDKIRRFARREE